MRTNAAPVGGLTAWTPATLREQDWLLHIDQPLTAIATRTQPEFHLPALTLLAERAKAALEAGPGLVVVRGMADRGLGRGAERSSVLHVRLAHRHPAYAEGRPGDHRRERAQRHGRPGAGLPHRPGRAARTAAPAGPALPPRCHPRRGIPAGEWPRRTRSAAGRAARPTGRALRGLPFRRGHGLELRPRLPRLRVARGGGSASSTTVTGSSAARKPPGSRWHPAPWPPWTPSTGSSPTVTWSCASRCGQVIFCSSTMTWCCTAARRSPRTRAPVAAWLGCGWTEHPQEKLTIFRLTEYGLPHVQEIDSCPDHAVRCHARRLLLQP